MCLAPTRWEVELLRRGGGRRGGEEAGEGVRRGFRFRSVKSRAAVILLSWREGVSTWSQRTSASPRLPQVGIKIQPSDGGMEGETGGGTGGRTGGRSPESSAPALIHRGFSHQLAGVWGRRSRRASASKTTTPSKINRRRFTFQLSIQRRGSERD